MCITQKHKICSDSFCASPNLSKKSLLVRGNSLYQSLFPALVTAAIYNWTHSDYYMVCKQIYVWKDSPAAKSWSAQSPDSYDPRHLQYVGSFGLHRLDLLLSYSSYLYTVNPIKVNGMRKKPSRSRVINKSNYKNRRNYLYSILQICSMGLPINALRSINIAYYMIIKYCYLLLSSPHVS